MVDRLAALERALDDAEARADTAREGWQWLGTHKQVVSITPERAAHLERIAAAERAVWRLHDAIEKARGDGALL